MNGLPVVGSVVLLAGFRCRVLGATPGAAGWAYLTVRAPAGGPAQTWYVELRRVVPAVAP